MRKAAATDFFIELPQVGTFRFGRRTYGDRLKIRAEYLRLTKDLADVNDAELATNAAIVAAHKVLCVEAPEGWADLESIDLITQPDADDKIFDLYFLLKNKEDSFRQAANPASQAPGEGSGPDVPVLVSP